MTIPQTAKDGAKGWLLAHLAVVALAGCTPATWSRTDTAFEVAYGATLAADYLQTKQIVADGMESNPVMGRRGQNLAPEIFFPVAMVAHLSVAGCLPRPWREIWQGVTIGWQSYAIVDNLQAGYAVRF